MYIMLNWHAQEFIHPRFFKSVFQGLYWFVLNTSPVIIGGPAFN